MRKRARTSVPGDGSLPGRQRLARRVTPVCASTRIKASTTVTDTLVSVEKPPFVTFVGAVFDVPTTDRFSACVGTSETAPMKNAEGEFPT